LKKGLADTRDNHEGLIERKSLTGRGDIHMAKKKAAKKKKK